MKIQLNPIFLLPSLCTLGDFFFECKKFVHFNDTGMGRVHYFVLSLASNYKERNKKKTIKSMRDNTVVPFWLNFCQSLQRIKRKLTLPTRCYSILEKVGYYVGMVFDSKSIFAKPSRYSEFWDFLKIYVSIDSLDLY